jgi:hypothetical protein
MLYVLVCHLVTAVQCVCLNEMADIPTYFNLRISSYIRLKTPDLKCVLTQAEE